MSCLKECIARLKNPENTLSKKKRVDSVNITESKNTKLTNNTNTAFDFVLDSSLAGFFGFCKASE